MNFFSILYNWNRLEKGSQSRRIEWSSGRSVKAVVKGERWKVKFFFSPFFFLFTFISVLGSEANIQIDLLLVFKFCVVCVSILFFLFFFCCHLKNYKFFATRFRWERIPSIGLVYHKHTLFDNKAFATKAWKGSECNRGSLKTRMYYIVVSPNKKWILFGMITVWRLLQIRRIWYGLFRYNSSTVTRSGHIFFTEIWDWYIFIS